MKHFLKIIWSFVKKLPKQVRSFIKPTKQITPIPINQVEVKANSKLPQRKIKKRLKTFKSFLRDEESLIQRSRRRRERLQRKRRSNRMLRSSLIISQSMDNSQHSEEENSKESFTNEIELAGPVVFQDNQGFEISIIIAEANSPEKVQQDAAESDEQLLHLICGDKEQSKNTNLQQIAQNMVFYKKTNSQYQQQNGKKLFLHKKQKHKTVKYTFNPQDDSLQSQQGSKLPSASGDRKKLKYKRQLKQEKSRLKVINLVDLVSNQDNPPIYQIPLYVEQTR